MRQGKWLARACGVLIVTWLALASVAAAEGFGDFGGFGGFGGFGATTTEEAPVVEEVPTVAPDGIPLGFNLVAENSDLELFIDTERAQLIVRDKNTKNIWRTNPDLVNNEAGKKIAESTPELWHDHMGSQLILEYTDQKRRTVKTTNNLNEKAIVSYEPIPKGVRIVFNMQALGFQIPVEYRLGEGYLEARVPEDGFVENGEYYVVSLDLLPFFGAAFDTEKGYMVIPDGPGAIVNFKDNNPDYNRAFQEMAYGPNDRGVFSNLWEMIFNMAAGRRPVSGPYFGLKSGEQAFLGLVTEGEFDVQINAAPAGNTIDMYRATAQFQIRKRYRAMLSKSRPVESIESKRVAGDRAVRYYLLNGEESTYVGMANVYRDYLKQKYNIVGRLGLKNDVAPLHLRIMCSVQKNGLVVQPIVDMTTFTEAREIVERMLAMGITNMDVTLVGWNKNGVDGLAPKHFPAESALGGNKGLKEFTSWAKSQGISVYLEDNYGTAYEKNGGFSVSTDVVRDASKQPIGGYGQFALSPLALYSKFMPKDLPNFAELGASGLDLTGWGSAIPYDRNSYYFAERADSALARLAMAQSVKNKLGKVIVQGGSLYFLAVTDAVYDAPVDPSTLVFVDYAIPFFQIVVHGLVPYYGYPGNLRNDPQVEFLRMVEYGALPTFELTYDSSSRLRDARKYFHLFSSQFEDWIDEVKKEYDSVNVKMGRLQRLAIVGHGQLQNNVFETKYEDGTRVIVNYQQEQPYVEGKITVPALDYRVIEGGSSK